MTRLRVPSFPRSACRKARIGFCKLYLDASSAAGTLEHSWRPNFPTFPSWLRYLKRRPNRAQCNAIDANAFWQASSAGTPRRSRPFNAVLLRGMIAAVPVALQTMAEDAIPAREWRI
jgi:hypothetical protein